MKVGVDGRFLVRAGARGVSRVCRTLLTALAETFPEDEWRVLLPREAGEAPRGAEPRRIGVPGRVLYGAGALTGRPRLDALLGDVDAMWLPAPAPVALSGRAPYLLTVHDLSWEQRPGDFTAYERLWHRLARPPALARGAARVATVSEATRELALTRWRLDPTRIEVVRPPLAPPGGPVAPASGRPFLLWVGAVEPRKGTDVMGAALARARERGLRTRVVVAGERRDGGWDDRDTEWRGHVSEAELHSLYAGALALVAPSRLEGLGLPPLEAALHGTPSILSDLPPFRETLGDAAVWVPPGDAGALADALLALDSDPERRAALGRTARAQVAPLTDPAPAAHAMRSLLAEAAGR